VGTLHGKDSALYMSPGTGEAVVISEAAEWTIDVDFDTDPDPALQDEWETRLKGLKRFSGSFSGNFDDAQDDLWDAAIANTVSKFYLYPDQGTTTRYYYGNIWPKVSVGGSVGGKETFSVDFEGDGQLAKNPA
jgi:hypothetical protein